MPLIQGTSVDFFALEGASLLYLDNAELELGSSFHFAVRLKNTVIDSERYNGQLCQKVELLLYRFDVSPTVSSPIYEYYYTSGDSVFQFLNYYNRFFLKYGFDVNMGDTLYSRIPFVQSVDYFTPDSMFFVIVDSGYKTTLYNSDSVSVVKIWIIICYLCASKKLFDFFNLLPLFQNGVLCGSRFN